MIPPLAVSTMWNLFESEFRQVFAAVVESHNEQPACSSPASVSLPDVAVQVRGRVVVQTAVARSDCFFNERARFVRIACNRT